MLAARGGEEAQRPSAVSPRYPEESEPQAFQGSAASSQRTHEPSLLGSGWSWQKDGRDTLQNSQYFSTLTSEDSDEQGGQKASRAASSEGQKRRCLSNICSKLDYSKSATA